MKNGHLLSGSHFLFYMIVTYKNKWINYSNPLFLSTMKKGQSSDGPFFDMLFSLKMVIVITTNNYV